MMPIMYSYQQLKELKVREFFSRHWFVLLQLILAYALVIHHTGWGGYRFIMMTLNTIRASYFYVVVALEEMVVFILEKL